MNSSLHHDRGASTPAAVASARTLRLTAPFSPVDALFTMYNLVLAAAWSVGAIIDRGVVSTTDLAMMAVALHLTGACVPWFLRGARDRLIGDMYPLLALPWFWVELGWLMPHLHRPFGDAPIVKLDSLVLGTHWHATLMANYHGAALSQFMYASYLSFFFLLTIVPIVMMVGGYRTAIREYTLRMLIVYIVCGICYMVFPVAGPIVAYPGGHTVTNEVCFRLTAFAMRVGDSAGTSFPSTHVAASAVIGIGAWRWFKPITAMLLTTEAALIAVSAVYTQNHYAIDGVAGLIVAALISKYATRPPAATAGV